MTGLVPSLHRLWLRCWAQSRLSALAVLILATALAIGVTDAVASTSMGDVSTAARAPVLSDDFDDNVLNASLWGADTEGSGVTVSEINQRLEITYDAGSAQAPGKDEDQFGASYFGRCRLRGDFDIRVDYGLVVWPPASGVRVSLGTGLSTTERTGFGPPDDFTGEPREVYLMNTEVDGVQGITATSDLSGKLRQVRTGRRVTGYYFDAGSQDWVAIFTGAASRFDTGYSLSSWSHDPVFGDQPVTVAFDNFVVTRGQLVCSRAGDISTVAGIGPGFGGDNGPATDARLSHPERIALDASGNLYIADRGNHRVRKVAASTGIITTVAGDGAAGFSGDGGSATSTSLNRPTGVAVGAAGNIYIADSFNHRVRKVDPSGVITTVAGNGNAGFSGDAGPALGAQLSNPTDVAVDAVGNLYIADRFNQRVRKVDTSGTITTVAGNGIDGFSGEGGPATSAALNGPVGVALDVDGNLLIVQKFQAAVRKVDLATGIITTVAGNGTSGFSGDGGPATDATLALPTDVTVDAAGNLYIAASGSSRIHRVDGTGTITIVAGSGFGSVGDGGPATAANLRDPMGVAVDGVGNLFISDSKNHRIRRVDASTQTITLFAGSFPPGFSGDGGPAVNALMDTPTGLAVDASGNLFIADRENHRIRRLEASTGIITTVAGNGTPGFSGDGGPATDASLNKPDDVTVALSGDLFFTDRNHRIRRVAASTGVITTVAGDGTPGFSGDGGPAIAAQLDTPTFLTIDALGNLYLSDGGNNRIRRIDRRTGVITTVAGNGSPGFSGDGGPATSAGLARPGSVALDIAGNLFIVDNPRVRRVDALTGIITTFAGTGGCCFSGDGGPAASSTMTFPVDVVVDGAGNLFISDLVNQRVRRVDALSGIITSVVGSGPTEPIDGSYTGDGGPATDATLAAATGIAIDRAGNLFIADIHNHVVRKVEGAAAPTPPLVSCNRLPATIVGTHDDDILVGTPGDDVIVGGPGNDVIRGLEGDDTICGGRGEDIIVAGPGADSVRGGPDSDIVSGGAGADTLFGGAGHDYIFGGDGDDFIRGGPGNDSVAGSGGDDLVFGGPGTDRLAGNGGDDLLFGEDDDDFFDCGPGPDLADGGPGRDHANSSCEIQLEIP